MEHPLKQMLTLVNHGRETRKFFLVWTMGNGKYLVQRTSDKLIPRWSNMPAVYVYPDDEGNEIVILSTNQFFNRASAHEIARQQADVLGWNV
jgi:hypothetical protein